MFYNRWLGWVILVAGLLFPVPAFARPLVVVLPFGSAPEVRQTMIRLLRERYEVVARPKLSVGQGASTATQSTAGQKPADVVLSGALGRPSGKAGWELRLSIFQGRSGQRTAELRYALERPELRNADVQTVARELFPAVEKSIAWKPRPQRQLVVTPPATQPSRVHLPFIEANFGFILGMRRFSFDEEAPPSEVRCYDRVPPSPDIIPQGRALRYSALPRCAGFNTAAAPGLRLDLTLYPLARLSPAPLRGLGVGMTFDWVFWPASPVCDRAADGSCSTFGEVRALQEYRLEVGLRWQWPLPRPWPSPTLSAQYGVHQFSVQASQTSYYLRQAEGSNATHVTVSDNNGLPDLRYQYLDLGIGMKVPYMGWEHLSIGGELGFHYHVMFAHGDIDQTFTDGNLLQGGYGPIRSSYGWRLAAAPAQLRWQARKSGVPGWLRAELAGYVENFRMQFQLASADAGNSLPPIRREPEQGARYLARGASDWYFGATVQIGYEY